jgi:hypothetical protein
MQRLNLPLYSLLTKSESDRLKNVTDVRNVQIKDLTVEEVSQIYAVLDTTRRKVEILMQIFSIIPLDTLGKHYLAGKV